jgi:hypothetical protein
MHELSRKTIAAAFGFAALIAGGMAGSAAGLDRSLLSAWTTLPQD